MANAADIIFAGIKDQVDKFLSTREVSEKTRKIVGATLERSRDYFDLCEKLGENPSSKVALAKFIAKDTIFVSKGLQRDNRIGFVRGIPCCLVMP